MGVLASRGMSRLLWGALPMLLWLVVAPSANATFPGDNGKIAFAWDDGAGTANAPRDVWTMDADGSNRTRLTSGPADDETPRWSPDGHQIVFARAADSSAPPQIFVMDADGSNLHPVGSASLGYGPVWSPEGTRIASSGGSQPGIFTMAADGSGVTA